MSKDFKNGFLRTLWILGEYLPVIIIGGGWAPLIYYHYLIKDKSKEPMRTRDIDLFVKIRLPIIGDRTIDQLLVESGLQPKFKSNDNPPVPLTPHLIYGSIYRRTMTYGRQKTPQRNGKRSNQSQIARSTVIHLDTANKAHNINRHG